MGFKGMAYVTIPETEAQHPWLNVKETSAQGNDWVNLSGSGGDCHWYVGDTRIGTICLDLHKALSREKG